MTEGTTLPIRDNTLADLSVLTAENQVISNQIVIASKTTQNLNTTNPKAVSQTNSSTSREIRIIKSLLQQLQKNATEMQVLRQEQLQ